MSRGLIDKIFDKLSDTAKRTDANNLAAWVDIRSYTSTNKYTFPSDGYVFVYNASNTSSYVSIEGATDAGSSLALGVTNSGRTGMFVRKGMKCYTVGTVSAARFNAFSGGGCVNYLLRLVERRWQHERFNRSGAVIPLGSDRLRDENAGDECDCIRRSNGRSIYTPDKKRLQNRSCHTDRDGRILRLLLSVNHDAERQADTDILPQYAYQRTSKQLLCLHDVYQGVATPERGCAA